jgi:2-polyprenyl-6-hydroxyphenyl methylase/3-demethylubiquinone-9 3-methyltransferase
MIIGKFRWRIAQFFEALWWRRYLRGKSQSEYLTWKKDYWRQFLADLNFHLSPDERILDAGCGPAGIFTILSNASIDAVDPLLDTYQNNLVQFAPEDYPNVHFYAQKLEDFYPEHVYDTVFCLNALNHVDKLPAALDRLAALVKPGARLVLSIDAHQYPFLQRIFHLFPGDILHPHQYNLAAYETMVCTRGFSIQQKQMLKKDLIFAYWALVFQKNTA